MKHWRNKVVLLAASGALLLAIPAASQQAPESLLPPGFDDPSAPLPARQEPEPGDQPPPGPGVPARPPLPPFDGTVIEDAAREDLEALADVEPPKPLEMPDWARRSPEAVGPLDASHWGLSADAYGRAHGLFLSTLMRRLDAPLPSRWTSILLRRSLLSRVPAPYAVSPVDWIAERAWLLLRMGEADGARMLVQAVDVDQFTPKMFAVAVQTALAAADPAGLCPLVEPGRKVSDERVWPLADAMCAALQGDATRASTLIDQVRRYGRTGGIDLLLAEKVVGAGTNTRRAVTIEWEPVDRLNSWRFGLASATGLVVPERLMGTVGPHVRAWQARAPMLPLEERLAAADAAASLGVFSNASLVEIYSLIADTTDPSEIAESVGGRLRTAYVGGTPAERVAAMRRLWDDASSPVQRHARLILTARAAGRLEPSEEFSGDAAGLIASMLTAGLDQEAARWSSIVGGMNVEDADRAWALLALGAPGTSVEVSSGRIGDFAERDESAGRVRSKLLLAGLAGLDRIPENAQRSLADDLGIDLARRDRWTAMIDSAGRRRQPGTVVLLAAVGMQTPDWRGVPPEHLYHIVRALRLSGRDYEARMIAAEALARL